VAGTETGWNLHITVEYQELNKVTPLLHAAMPSAKDILDQLTLEDLANTFFSIDLVLESQDQFAFTWQGHHFW
jgi:hypothetical protein